MDDRGLRFAEAWFRLLAEAARGTLAAQATIRSLADAELTPEKLAGRIAKWLPAGVAPPRGEALQQWTEDLWKTVGVVPRSRHIELLERYEALRSRLEEAEVTIRRLKRLLSEVGVPLDPRTRKERPQPRSTDRGYIELCLRGGAARKQGARSLARAADDGCG